MSDRIAWVTGAGGEIGQALIPRLVDEGYKVLALDLKPLPQYDKGPVDTLIGDILETEPLKDAMERLPPTRIFHLAALLSSRSEQQPYLAHRINVNGSIQLLELAEASALKRNHILRFFFPSSIAAYGIPDATAKKVAGAVHEDQYASPYKVYGCHKRYLEMFGDFLNQRLPPALEAGIDFRSLRYPGLISAHSLPSGGSSDFAPEMIHAAAKDESYVAWVRPDTQIPFLTMPDAVDATLQFMDAPRSALSRSNYNIRGFAPTAETLADHLKQRMPTFEVHWTVDPKRQALLDGWPADVDDLRARTDWGFAPKHDLEAALDDYLLPALQLQPEI